MLCIIPASRKRTGHLRRACEIFLRHKAPDTVCGWVRNIRRPGQEQKILTLRQLAEEKLDMFCTVFIGNRDTKVVQGRMVTPGDTGKKRPGEIGSRLMKSRKTDGRKKDENYTGRNGDGESRYADPGRLVRAGTGPADDQAPGGCWEAAAAAFWRLRLEAVAPQAILRLIEEAPKEKICVVFSGDTGFYSGAKK